MALTTADLETLKVNSLSFTNAKILAEQVEADKTFGGVFPKGNDDDFSLVDKEKFKDKWCAWWKVARILLKIAKAFTGDRGDKAIDKILEVGNQICV